MSFSAVFVPSLAHGPDSYLSVWLTHSPWLASLQVQKLEEQSAVLNKG